MEENGNAEESTTTDGASQLEQVREIVKKAIAEMREAGLLAYSQGGFGDGGDFEVYLWRNDAAKSLHGGPYVVTIKGSSRNQPPSEVTTEGDEGYYDDPLELSPELQAYYERGPSPRRTTEKQMEEAQRKREYGHSRPSVDDYDPMYDDPNYEEPME